MKTNIILLLSVFLISCTGMKETSQSNAPSTAKTSDEIDETANRLKTLTENGFIKATVINKKGENGCGFLLRTEDNKVYIPTSWIVPEYKEEGKVVYVKFTDSKLDKNDCNEAKSIEVEEMKLLR